MGDHQKEKAVGKKESQASRNKRGRAWRMMEREERRERRIQYEKGMEDSQREK